MADNQTLLAHASCVSIGGAGVLLRGASGAGKSDVALRLIDGGALLVADDQVHLARVGEQLVASAPARLSGLIEVRGLGIYRFPPLASCAVSVIIDLVGREAVERMPEAAFTDCLGVRLPLHCLHAFDASTPAKIRLAADPLRRSDT